VVRPVFLNLLSNTEESNPEGGRGHIEWEVEDRVVRITVRDSGIDFSEDQLETGSHPFVRVGTDPTRRHRATGLGLAISRELQPLPLH
jgi:signal transduction histidine kinase